MSKNKVLEDLKQHLQTAIMLEFSTIPPYLCAYWSIYGDSPNAKRVKHFILSVLQEEMLHMAMACNILNAIGGKPVLNDPNLLPAFPGPLPGHSKTINAFIVELDKCCPASISTFLKIEMPEEMFKDKSTGDGWCTIGEFYEEIEKLIKSDLLNDDDFSYGRQIGNNFNPAKGTLYEVHNRNNALLALDEIIDQGEGHSGKMYDKDHELTHYWKFKLVFDLMQNGLWDYKSEVYDMAVNPDERNFSQEAKIINHKFNTSWTSLLNEMHAAFNSEKPSLDESINIMMSLKSLAIELMRIPQFEKKGNCGPTFTYLE